MIRSLIIFALLLCFSVYSIATENKNIVIQNVVNNQINSRHVICMATAIYFESRNEPIVGQIAVGLVVKNRSEHTQFPKDICDVVFEGPHDNQGKPKLNRCQFSWYCDGRKHVKMQDDEARNRAISLAKLILSNKMFDFTDGAIFFHSTSVSPQWRFRKIGAIGNHIFYKV